MRRLLNKRKHQLNIKQGTAFNSLKLLSLVFVLIVNVQKCLDKLDLEIKPVLEWKEERSENCLGMPHTAKTQNFTVHSGKVINGGLYHEWETPSGDDIIKQLILLKMLRQEVLRELHDTRTSGHLGVAKTHFIGYSAGGISKIGAVILTCAHKRSMGKYTVGSPMECIAIDVLGPLYLFFQWPIRKPAQLQSY